MSAFFNISFKNMFLIYFWLHSVFAALQDLSGAVVKTKSLFTSQPPHNLPTLPSPQNQSSWVCRHLQGQVMSSLPASCGFPPLALPFSHLVPSPQQGEHGSEVSSVQALSRVHLSPTPWAAAGQAPLSITSSRSPQTHAHHWSPAAGWGC